MDTATRLQRLEQLAAEAAAEFSNDDAAARALVGMAAEEGIQVDREEARGCIIVARARPRHVDREEFTADDGVPPSLADLWSDGLLDRALDPHRVVISAGMGAWFDHVLGGGLQPGNMMALGAEGAGQGKTAFAHQLADGMAKASAAAVDDAAGSGVAPKVVPVLFVSEMGAMDLTWRTLAREAATPGYLLRAPNCYTGAQYAPGESETVGTLALQAARVAAAEFKPAAEFITLVDRTISLGADPIGAIGTMARRIRDGWAAAGADVTTVLVVVDPLHRLLNTELDETPAIGAALGQLLRITQTEGLVTLLTSDTTKAAVGGRNQPDQNREQAAELGLRGSYQLVHLPDFVFSMRVQDPDTATDLPPTFMQRDGRAGYYGQGDWKTAYADLASPKLRWSAVGKRPAFWYDRALFRYVPMPLPPREL